MDGLDEEERALAWAVSWNPSFSGIAIVNRDFTFRSVNQQFCKILGVTPAELIGVHFQDITPPAIRKLDEDNARLVIKGTITNYILPKSFEFPNGKKVDVTLLVTGVYQGGKFLFFVYRIVQMSPLSSQGSTPPYSIYQTPTGASSKGVTQWLKKHYGKILTGVGLLIGALLKGKQGGF